MPDVIATKSSDLTEHTKKRRADRKRKKNLREARKMRKNLAKKTFASLTESEKDDLLKAIAMRLDLIAPDE
jgi:hypothetical protein